MVGEQWPIAECIKQALTDRPLALPQSLNGLPEMAQLGSGGGLCG